METTKRQYWTAVTFLVGSIIGVGIFGVPYVMSRVGLIPSLIFFLVLGGIQVLQGLFFAEAAIASRENHGLPGLAGIYLGKTYGRIGAVALVLGFWASLTAYVAVGGTFLSVMFQPLFGGSVMIYALVWGVLGGLAVRYGLKVISRLETVGTVALIMALAGILLAALPHVRMPNISAVSLAEPFLPYGVILFSLSGLSAIAEMKKIVGGRTADYRRSVVVGTVVAAVITFLFGLVVWGVSGGSVTKDAVSGLQQVLGSWIAVPVALAGFLAVATSYFSTAVNVRDSFVDDSRLSPDTSWLLATLPPIGLYLFAKGDFLTMISLSGAVFGGIVSVIVGLLYLSIRRRKLVTDSPLRIPPVLVHATMLVLAVGAVMETVDIVMNYLI